MGMDEIAARGLHLLGCGRMGSAMLAGWIARGLPASAVWVSEPGPSPWLEGLADDGLHLNQGVPDGPAVAVLAVKPQMMGDALPSVAALGGGDTLILSIAAGTPIAHFEAVFGDDTPIIRAMPNTPAAIGQGITAIIGNQASNATHLAQAQALLSAVGAVVQLDDEAQMDAVTAVSGSGPAYVFYLIEALAAAGRASGLAEDLAMQLARATVTGAAALAAESPDSASQLRTNVTSPGGTTEAGLRVLMDRERGLSPLMHETVQAAARRSRELRG